LNRAKANQRAAGWAAFIKILHRALRGCSLLALSLLASVCWSALAQAQEELPQIIPGEHKIPTKKDLGPRALGLLQMGEKGKTSLVPIAILINGKFWDASVYKADPVPMALESGTVYEVERTGSSQGLFTVGGALHSNSVNAPVPWLATGLWVPAGAEAKNTAIRAAAAPIGLTDTDAPPRLTRDPDAVYPHSKPASMPSQPSSPPSSGSGSGDEPPRLTKPASETESSPNSAPASTSPQGAGKSGSSQASAPNSSKPGQSKSANQPNVPIDDSGADATGRPRLRYGKPAVSFADEQIPGYSKPGAAPVDATTLHVAAKSTAPPEPTQLVPAISDAAGPEPHSYVYQWIQGEESQRHDQMLTLAKQQLAAYVQAETKQEIKPEEHPPHALHRVSNQKSPEPVFENAKMVAYDLWTTNQPILVFTADGHAPPSAAGAKSGAFSNLTYSVTLVAYPDIYNNLHKLYAGVTDKYHLDVTPRLELIDAVDADGDGRGELLFRETSDAGSGWVVYRATADTLWKMYDSLNPE
jgi:hypothetical protein